MRLNREGRVMRVLSKMKKPQLVAAAMRRGTFCSRSEASRMSADGLRWVLHADTFGLITRCRKGRGGR